MQKPWTPHILTLEESRERSRNFLPTPEQRIRFKESSGIEWEPHEVLLARIEATYKDLIWDDELKIGTPIVLDNCVAYEPANWDPMRFAEDSFVRYEIETYHSGKHVEGQREDAWTLRPGDPCFLRAGCLWVLEEGEDWSSRRANNDAVFIEDVQALPEPNAVQGARFVKGRRCCMIELVIPFHGKTRYMVHGSNIRYRR